ncbi:unnamed protein product, partial [Staurois parvus]
MLCIRCSSALISLPGSNLISIPGSNLISFLAAISSAFLAAISSAFLAAISSASWQQSLVTEGCFHTWMSSDSQLTRPLIHHAPKHGFSLSFLFSPTLCAKPHLFM